jgi:hypothetical protein
MEKALILVISAPNAYTLSQYLARISIFSEDVDKKGQIVSWEEAVKLKPYAYLGHNLPGKTIVDFYANIPDNGLNECESHLAQQIENLRLFENESFYMIGFLENDPRSKQHELSHAMFNLCSDYKNLVEQLYESIIQSDRKIKIKLENCLELRGYSRDLFIDEFGAYLLEGDYDLCKIIGKDSFSSAQQQLVQLLKLYESQFQQFQLECNKLLKPKVKVKVRQKK